MSIIKEGEIIGFTYEIWYGGSCIHEDDMVYETEEEAVEEAEKDCEDIVDGWENDGAFLDGTELEDLKDGIVINDIVKDGE